MQELCPQYDLENSKTFLLELGIDAVLLENRSFQELTRDVNTYLRWIDDKEKDVIIKRYGLNGEKKTLKEIGNEFGVTKERIRQIEQKALYRMKNPYRSQKKRSIKDRLRILIPTLSYDILYYHLELKEKISARFEQYIDCHLESLLQELDIARIDGDLIRKKSCCYYMRIGAQSEDIEIIREPYHLDIKRGNRTLNEKEMRIVKENFEYDYRLCWSSIVDSIKNKGYARIYDTRPSVRLIYSDWVINSVFNDFISENSLPTASPLNSIKKNPKIVYHPKIIREKQYTRQ